MHDHIIETLAVALLLATGVFAATLWRRWIGGVALCFPFLVSLALYLEFADPVMAGGIDIAYGSRVLLQLKSLPFVTFGLSLLAFWLASQLRPRRAQLTTND
jgi:hypothetical protein